MGPAHAVLAVQQSVGNSAVVSALAPTLQRQEAPPAENAAGRVARLLHEYITTGGNNDARDQLLRACMSAAGQYDAVATAFKLVEPNRSLLDAAKLLPRGQADGARVFSYLRFGASLRLADKLYFAAIGAGTDNHTITRLLPDVRADRARVDKDLADTYGGTGPTAYSNDYSTDGTLADGSTPSRTAGLLAEEADSESERAQFVALLTFGEVRTADELYMALNSMHALHGSVMAPLDKAAANTPPGSKPTIEADYSATYKRELDPILKAELGEAGDDYAKARSILDGGWTPKKRIKMAVDGVGTSMKEIWAALDDARRAGQLEPLRTEWATGGEIKTWINDEWTVTDAEKKRIAAILEDKGDMDSRLLQLGLEVDDTKEILGAALERDDVATSFAAEWKNRDGTFYKAFTQDGKRGTVWGDQVVTGTVLQKLDLAATVLDNEKAVLALLARPDVDDTLRRNIRIDYLLLRALQGMDAWPRIEPLIQPKDDLSARADWMKRKFNDEATSGMGLGADTASAYAFDDEARELDVALGAAKDPHNLTPDERKVIGPKAKSTEDALTAFIRTRDELDAVAIQVLGAVLGLLATVATGGTAGPVVAGMLARAALAQGVASVAAVWAVKGERVTGPEAARAFAVGSVSGATGALLPSPIMSALSPAYKEAVRTGAVQVAEQIAAREFSTVGLGVVKGTLEGAGAGAAGGLVDAASRADTWKYGFIDGLKTTIGDGLKGAVTGGATGGGLQLIRLSLFGSKPGGKPANPGEPPPAADAPAALDRATIDRAKTVLSGSDGPALERWNAELLPALGSDGALAGQALAAARKELLDAAVARARPALAAKGVDVKVTPAAGLDGVVDLEFVPVAGSPTAAQTGEMRAATLRSAAELVAAELGTGAEARLGVKLRAEGDVAAGGVMGPDVYEKTRFTLKPEKLEEMIKKGVVTDATAAAADNTWAVPGTTFKKAGGALAYVMEVPVGPAPAPGTPAPTARVEVQVVIKAAADLSKGAHPTAAGTSQGGAGRVGLSAPAKAGEPWIGRIEVDANLNQDLVRFVVGHEADEIALIIKSGATTQAEIEAQMRAGIFTTEPTVTAGPVRPTAHDYAVAKELFDLSERFLETTAADKQRMINKAMEKLVGYMGLDNTANMGAKLAVLRGQGSTKAWGDFLRELETGLGKGAIDAAYPTGAGPAGGLTAAQLNDLATHLMVPEAHSGTPLASLDKFRTDGIYGGHDDAMLLSWVANTDYGYAVVQQLPPVAGPGFTARSYAQYLWTGGGKAPQFVPGAAGWELSMQPKTTVDNMAAFMRALNDEMAKNPAAWNTRTGAVQFTLGAVTAEVRLNSGVPATAYPRM
jgi:hypothetical protein